MFLITCHSEELKCKPLKQNLQTQEIKQAHLTLHCDHECWKTQSFKLHFNLVLTLQTNVYLSKACALL